MPRTFTSHHPVPFLFADLLERLQGEIGEQGGVVDKDVHGAEFAHRIGHEVLNRLLRGNIGAHVDGGPLRLANALGDRAAVQHVGDDHLGTGGGQSFAKNGADPARATGDDRNFILKTRIHGFPFPRAAASLRSYSRRSEIEIVLGQVVRVGRNSVAGWRHPPIAAKFATHFAEIKTKCSALGCANAERSSQLERPVHALVPAQAQAVCGGLVPLRPSEPAGTLQGAVAGQVFDQALPAHGVDA